MSNVAAAVITPQEIQREVNWEQGKYQHFLEDVLDPYLIPDIIDIVSEYAVPKCYQCNPYFRTRTSACDNSPIAECAICKVGLCRYHCEERGLWVSVRGGDQSIYCLSKCYVCYHRSDVNADIRLVGVTRLNSEDKSVRRIVSLINSST